MIPETFVDDTVMVDGVPWLLYPDGPGTLSLPAPTCGVRQVGSRFRPFMLTDTGEKIDIGTATYGNVPDAARVFGPKFVPALKSVGPLPLEEAMLLLIAGVLAALVISKYIGMDVQSASLGAFTSGAIYLSRWILDANDGTPKRKTK